MVMLLTFETIISKPVTFETIISKPVENDSLGSTCTFFNWTKCKKPKKNQVKYVFSSKSSAEIVV